MTDDATPISPWAGAGGLVAGLADGDQPARSRVPATRRTKIVATLGPACDRPETIAAMVAAGADCFRLNCSHGSPGEHAARARRVRTASRRAGRPLALMVDLQGPKIRLDPATPIRRVERGEAVTLVGTGDAGPPGAVRIGLRGLAEAVRVGGEIAIGDGTPRLIVEDAGGGAVRARALVAGSLGPSKGVALPDARLAIAGLTAKDVSDLDLACRIDADYVALSFVRTAADVEQLREQLRRRGARARVIAKIERTEAYRRLDEILAVADGVMVARGDYGLDAGLRNVPLMQKDVIARACAAGRLVVTATQMLESMIHAALPTRAEVSDVVNAVLDGTSAVMLSAETSVGAFPVEAVETMAELVAATDAARGGGAAARLPHGDEPGEDAPIAAAAIELAWSVSAQAIVVPAQSGTTARACSRLRPPQRIVAPCLDAGVASQLALEWGIESFDVRRRAWGGRVLDVALGRVARQCELASGAPVVVAAGVRSRTANTIAVRTLPAAGPLASAPPR